MRLLLMRHAEAAASGAHPDHERPLTDRGRQDAAAMGRWLRDRGTVPDLVLCSSALRARQTWQAVTAVVPGGPEPSYSQAVYDAGPGEILDLLGEQAEGSSTVMVVGHNPTMAHLVAALTGETPGFPAGSIAVVDLSGSWQDPDDGALTQLVGPRDHGHH